MTTPPAISVVLPLYRTRAAVPELTDRLVASLGPMATSLELIFVDDCCPERSYEAVAAAPTAGVEVVVHRHPQRRGQHAAILSGLRLARGDVVAIMDADLQDAPEDLARLVAELRRDRPPHQARPDAVAAARAGRYEPVARRASGRAYRWLVTRLSGGRIPPGAGLFMALTRSACDRVVALGEPDIHPVAALARAGATVEATPVLRHPRPYGGSSYTVWSRARVASRSLAALRRHTGAPPD